MFAQSNGYSLSDIAAVNGNNRNGGAFGDDGWWIILLFLFGLVVLGPFSTAGSVFSIEIEFK